MISVEEAKRIIASNIQPLAAKKLPIVDAMGLVLAEDIVSPINIPSFRQSSMDGYAYRFEDWKVGEKLKLSTEVPAGSPSKKKLKRNAAARIFTGAVVPEGADTVVMQEKVKINDEGILIEDATILQGENVRPIGMEIKAGDLALAKSTLLKPAAIGLLASLGITKILVYPKPKISIIITGNELVRPGNELGFGQVYDSNSFMLKSALEGLGIHQVVLYYVKDSLKSLNKKLEKALEESDLVFLAGGISVGDYDFVLQATIDNGVEKLFHRIKQRPAKPLYFGKKGNKYVFGFPGNPASGLSSFYLYALPAIAGLMNKETSIRQKQVPLAKSFRKKKGLTHFLKGYYNGSTAIILEGQESFRLRSFAQSNCLIQIDEELEFCEEGSFVPIYLLPK